MKKKNFNFDKRVLFFVLVVVVLIGYFYFFYHKGFLYEEIKVLEEKSNIKSEVEKIYFKESGRKDFLILGLALNLDVGECGILRMIDERGNLLFDIFLDRDNKISKSISYSKYLDYSVIDNYIIYKEEGLVEREDLSFKDDKIYVEYYSGICFRE